MTCLVLDDEPLALRILQNYLRQTPSVQPVGFYTNPVTAQTHCDEESVDLLFLDIHMPDVNGLDFYHQLTKKPLVIFTTAYRQYAVEGFELDAVDYLIKPIEFPRFQKAISRAQAHFQLRQQHQEAAPPQRAIFVHSAYEVKKILLTDLYAAETYGDYIKLYLTSQAKPIITLLSLKKLMTMLPSDAFIRVHRSYLVARKHMLGRQGKRLQVRELTVPIGRTYFPSVRKLFSSE